MSADEDQEKSEATRARRRHRGWRATGAVGRAFAPVEGDTAQPL